MASARIRSTRASSASRAASVCCTRPASTSSAALAALTASSSDLSPSISLSARANSSDRMTSSSSASWRAASSFSSLKHLVSSSPTADSANSAFLFHPLTCARTSSSSPSVRLARYAVASMSSSNVFLSAILRSGASGPEYRAGRGTLSFGPGLLELWRRESA